MKKQILVKALFALSILLGVLLIAAAIFVKWTSLPDLAEILPLETESFYLVKTAHTGTVLKSPYVSESWVDAYGSATVDNAKLTILQINSSEAAEQYLKSLKTEGETWESTRATASLWSQVTCYSKKSQPCFTWMGDLLLLSEDQDLLSTVQKVASGEEDSLKSSSNYQNIRGRLASWRDGFIYADLQKVFPRYQEDFPNLEPLLALYPAVGMSLRFNQKWQVESTLAIDKTLIEDDAYWHPTEKYSGRLLPWTSESFAVEWGGQNLGEQWAQVQNVLKKRTPLAAQAWDEEIQNKVENLFGPDVDFGIQLMPLLNGEQYLGFTPGSDFLFITQLDSNEEVTQALQLKDLFAEYFLYGKTYRIESGETRAEWIPVEESTSQYQGYQYYSFSAEGNAVATVLLTENLALIGGQEQTVFTALDRSLGLQAPRTLDNLDSLITGSDELFTLHCLLLPEGSILKTLLSDFDTIITARKLFDDGSFSRSVVQLSTP